MFKPFAVFFVFIMLINSACAVSAPASSSTEVRVSIEDDSIKLDNTELAGEIKFTITNNSSKSQYVIIAPAECAADEDPSTTPTPECKEKFIEQSLIGYPRNETWELTVHLEPGDYVIESMVMASGPIQLTKSYFTVKAP